VINLSENIAKTISLPPKIDSRLSTANAYLSANETISAKKQITWIKITDGKLLYGGLETLTATPKKPCIFPFTQHSWAQALAPTALTPISSEHLISTVYFWRHLRAFHNTLFACESRNATHITIDQENRIKKAHQLKNQRLKQTQHNLESILNESKPIPYCGITDDPLINALTLIGKSLSIEIINPHQHHFDTKEEKLTHTLQTSNIRFRAVKLQKKWWENDSGPLLGYLQNTKQPVALMPSASHHYTIINPETNRRYSITAQNQAEIEPIGYMLYRTFPEKRITKRELAKFSLKNQTQNIVILLFFSALSGLLSILPPIGVGILFRFIIPSANIGLLVQFICGWLICILATLLCNIPRNMIVLRLVESMNRHIQAATINHLLALPPTFFKRFLAGDLAAKANSFHAARQKLHGTDLAHILTGLFSFFHIGLLFYLNWQMAIGATAMISIYCLYIVIKSIFYVIAQKKFIRTSHKETGIVFQFISGITKLKTTACEQEALSAWSQHFSRCQKTYAKLDKHVRSFTSFGHYFHFPSLILLLVIEYYILDNSLPTSTFLAFYMSYSYLMLALQNISQSMLPLFNIATAYTESKPIFDARPEIQTQKTNSFTIEGHLDLNHLSFRYQPDLPLVLENMSLSIKPGEYVAIVGPSGSGKSTLLRLLLGFNTPDIGTVLYDSKNLNRLSIQTLRKQIGVVLQNSALFPGTILSNIIGSRATTQDEIQTVIQQTGLDNAIQALPMGFNTVIPEGATVLSTGQKQLILIARALLKQPKILFFDEATNALDRLSQKRILKSIQHITATRVVIAHRLDTIKTADTIIVLNNGKIVQKGTYATLAKCDGLFKSLIQKQR